MHLSCIIIENYLSDKKALQACIEDTGIVSFIKFFPDVFSALAFLRQNQIDLVFLDVELLKSAKPDLPELLSFDTNIILTTHALEDIPKLPKPSSVEYLMKPFSFKEFIKIVLKVVIKNPQAPEHSPLLDDHQSANKFFFVKHNGGYVRVDVGDIQYIKSEGDYTKLITSNAQYLISHTLNHWRMNLPHKYFYQIHKSYLVNVHYIHKVSGNQVFIGEATLPLGRTFREGFFNEYLIRWQLEC